MYSLMLLRCVAGKIRIILHLGTSFWRSEGKDVRKKHLEELQSGHVKGRMSSLDNAFVFWKLVAYKIINFGK